MKATFALLLAILALAGAAQAAPPDPCKGRLICIPPCHEDGC
jgi:hypothetical protein